MFKTPKLLYSVPFLGIVLFVFSVGFPPFDDLTTVNLSVHMLEHVLILIAGAMVGYPLFKTGAFSNLPVRALSYASLIYVIIVLTYWHFPTPWDSAVLNPLMHAIEHGSMFLCGFVIGAFFPYLSARRKLDALALGFGAHIIYGLALIFSFQIYPLYSIEQQLWLGIWVFMPTPVYMYGIVIYTILGHQSFAADLREQFGINVSGIKDSFSRFTGQARKFIPVLTLGMLVTLGVYFSIVGLTIATASGAPPSPSSVTPSDGGTTTVYILESPVTWNYSPQHVNVVIGVNNTVVWVSKSISIDTITSQTGLFDSGNIDPGGTYSHTFTAPGTYTYDCIYHPWMIGSVTVKAAV